MYVSTYVCIIFRYTPTLKKETAEEIVTFLASSMAYAVALIMASAVVSVVALATQLKNIGLLKRRRSKKDYFTRV